MKRRGAVISASTRLVLTPGQMVAVIAAVVSLVLYLTDLRAQVRDIHTAIVTATARIDKLEKHVR